MVARGVRLLDVWAGYTRSISGENWGQGVDGPTVGTWYHMRQS